MARLVDKLRPIGGGYFVRFTFEDGLIEAAWTPGLPQGRTDLIPHYRKIRQAFADRVAREFGVNVAVLEVL